MVGSQRCHSPSGVSVRTLVPWSKGLHGNAASSIPFSLPSSVVFLNARGQLQHQRMQKFCSFLTRIHPVISQECQLGKIPSQQDQVSGMVKHYGSLEVSEICSLLWSPSFPFFLQPRNLLKHSRFPFSVSHQVQTQQTHSFLPGTHTAQICPGVCPLSFLCHL